jgi:hypothetical protein
LELAENQKESRVEGYFIRVLEVLEDKQEIALVRLLKKKVLIPLFRIRVGIKK